MAEIYVLRLGHRPGRDKRITTHVCLVARAFGAKGVYYTGKKDENLELSIKKVVDRWGGPFFVQFVRSWREFVKEWKKQGTVVHLTMYGINLPKIVTKLRKLSKKKDILIVVGSEKVPGDVYDLADFNVAVSNQPHSEVAALAVFLDWYFEGKELEKDFENAKVKVIPQERGKKLIKV